LSSLSANIGQIPTESVQWPSNELRRISVNSFGFGGTNAHVVLDDTYNYLHQQSITRSLSRARAWPNTAGSRLAQLVKNGHGSAIEEQTNGSNGTDRTNGNSHLQGSESENGKTNGFHSTQKNGWDLPQGSKLPKLLVWSASDEKALKRMIQSYNDYQNANVTSSPAIVDELAYTLAARRSRLLWRTSAVVGQDMFSQAGAFPVNPLNRSSSNTRLAYAFTGQGSQYVKMGLELIHYPVFKETLQSIQSIYSSFGCDWTIPGMHMPKPRPSLHFALT
jgi:acyl transferase domain-containing protein